MTAPESDPKRQIAEAGVKKAIDAAAALGAPLIHAPSFNDSLIETAADLANTAHFMQKMCDYAADRNILVCTETCLDTARHPELLARVAVRLREHAVSPLGEVYTCGKLTLDTASHTVLAAGEPVLLTRTEYAILKLLMQNPGQVLAKSTLLDRISADTPDCTERSLKQHVSNLRHKLAAKIGEDCIEAVWGIGFRLKA